MMTWVTILARAEPFAPITGISKKFRKIFTIMPAPATRFISFSSPAAVKTVLKMYINDTGMYEIISNLNIDADSSICW